MIDNNTGFSAGIDAAFEAAEAARAAEEKAQAEREEKRMQQEADARRAETRRRYSIRKAIVDAAIALGSTGHTTEDVNTFFIDGVDCSFWLSFVEERTHLTKWRSSATGKLRLTVGDFGNRKSYPQKKDGTHNYEEIARVLRGYAARKTASRKAEAMRAKNDAAAVAIAKEFNLPSYCGLVVPSSAAPGKVMLDLSKVYKTTMTPEHARKVLQALRDLGIKLSYNDK